VFRDSSSAFASSEIKPTLHTSPWQSTSSSAGGSSSFALADPELEPLGHDTAAIAAPSPAPASSHVQLPAAGF
jgi:hypothetical protein